MKALCQLYSLMNYEASLGSFTLSVLVLNLSTSRVCLYPEVSVRVSGGGCAPIPTLLLCDVTACFSDQNNTFNLIFEFESITFTSLNLTFA